MRRTPRGSRRVARGQIALMLTLALVASFVAVVPALAAHPEASLSGSNFEIDEDANLKLDDVAPSINWASVTEVRGTDLETGQDDDSYKGGVKEDTECPAEVTGSIPNNKSDLLTFHVYEEEGTPGFMNLAWSRVSDPSGTTLMDFEFNQGSTPCAQGPNIQRTEGDLLIEYAIDQGGARAEISGRFWTGTAWGPPVDLDDGTQCDGQPCATGTINTSVIPAADADGLGEKQARTFGEAQIDLDLIFDEGECGVIGNAMLKSRSSDSFTSQLKDFIRPETVDIQNCANVIIRKQTDPDGSTAEFNFDKTFATDPATDASFNLTDDGVQDYGGLVLFGEDLTVTEDLTALPAGWAFTNVDCSASTGVTPVIGPDGALVTFDLDDPDDVLDCTYNNQARGTIVVEKITDDGFGSFDFTSNTLTPASFTLTTTAAGDAGKDSRTFGDLPTGTYDVAETVPAGWNLVSASCDDGSDPSSIGLDAGETVTCTFHDSRERGAIEITKTRKHAAAGSATAPHEGVTFTVTGGELSSGMTVVTDANGAACVDGLVLSSFVGDYTVTETVPDGYVADGATAKTVSVTTEASCGDGNEAGVSFSNTPLTNVTVSVDSQVDGGTASTISCVNAADEELGAGETGANGDGSVTVEDLEPTAPGDTLICTIVVDP